MRKWFLCAAFVLITQFLWAQQAEVSGLVTDPSGAVIPKADISLRNTATNAQQTSTSNDSGTFSFAGIQPGIYQAEVKAAGFESRIVENMKVDVAAKVTLNFSLRVSPTATSVTVNGEQIYVNTADASVSSVVDRQFVENIPLNGRSFQSLMTAVPGVLAAPSQGAGIGGEISVNGQRTEANYFTVDGVSANTGASSISGTTGFGGGFSGATPSETVLGTTQNLVALDALQEFRASTSTYSAEYGRTPGGQFSFTSRPGTNQWHGSAFEYLRNSAMDSNNWFNGLSARPKPAERQNDFGGTFGGPILKNKTFFFGSYEGLRLQSPQAAVLTGVPSMSVRTAAPPELQTFLKAYPIPNGPDHGNGIAEFSSPYSSPNSIGSGSVRVDHNFSDAFKIFGRFSYSASDNVSRDPAELSTVVTSNFNVKAYTIGATNLLSPRLTNKFRFNLTDNDANSIFTLDNFGGATPFSLSDVPGLGNSNDNWFIFNFFYDIHARLGLAPQRNSQRQLNFVDTVSFAIGRHNAKIGADYRRLSNTSSLPPVYEFGYAVDQDEILNNQMEGAILKRAFFPMKPMYTNLSLFASDDWRVTPRLSLSFGLRWEYNPPPSDADGNSPYTIDSTDPATAKLLPKRSALWKTTYNNFAPRAGFAYQLNPSAGHQTVVRGGAGVFYDLATANASEGYGGIGISSSLVEGGVPLPYTHDQINSLPQPTAAAPYDAPVLGFDPQLKLPHSLHWNFAVEQALGEKQSLTLNYVASAGRRLFVQKLHYPSVLANPNFGDFDGLYITRNGASSNYNSLQVSFVRRFSYLQTQTSYTWSHSIDDVSSNFFVFEQLRGDSDFDVRHNFQTALTYDLPGGFKNRWAAATIGGWAFDARISARSALPVDILAEENLDLQNGADTFFHPNRVPGQPLYKNISVGSDGSPIPGGRVINFAAFDFPPSGTEGDAGRNSARGFNAVQADVALRKDFRIRENVELQFRAEAFNVFNHPNFGNINNQLPFGPDLFGQASGTLNTALGGFNPLYQTGGPRSLQLALRLHF